MSTNGTSMLAPKNLNSSAGVAKIPSKFPRAALHKAEATDPPEAEVKNMHIFTVVGRQVNIKSPSSRGFGSKDEPVIDGITFPNNPTSGRPTRKGQARNKMDCINAFNFIFPIACFNSDTSRDNPDSRNMTVTPYFPIISSGRNKPPFTPSFGAHFAMVTAANIPRTKKFFDANFESLSKRDASSPPPLTETADKDFAATSYFSKCCPSVDIDGAT
mmetsp:Transcript_10200/g.15208  ORF Transcript_10200/g.15208 Transcript_10200/m.15208 type:complete len:216 (+) Transcript_10200:750-1397(+)